MVGFLAVFLPQLGLIVRVCSRAYGLGCWDFGVKKADWELSKLMAFRFERSVLS